MEETISEEKLWNSRHLNYLKQTGNYTPILTRLDRNFTSREATILLYSPALDPHLQKMTDLADRMFCIYEGEKAPEKG